MRVGEYDIERDGENDNAQELEVKQIVVHPKFNARSFYNDIAILKLKKKVSGMSETSETLATF